eukprot:COSAG06_NODE_39320_length_414_cov_0.587302_1_plen_39_part_10
MAVVDQPRVRRCCAKQNRTERTGGKGSEEEKGSSIYLSI